jgi:hypothetical protein
MRVAAPGGFSMPFKVRYDFSFDDFKAAQKAMRARRPLRVWLVRMAYAALMLLLPAMLILTNPKGADWQNDILPMVLLVAAVWAVFEILHRTYFGARLACKRFPIAGQSVSGEIGEKGISLAADGMRSEYDWHAFKSVSVSVFASPAAAALSLNDFQYVVLPARAFASREEFESAVSFARAKMR